MSSFSVGRQAEQVAAEYLQAKGYIVIDRNWRTRYCEIDIVATKDALVYFVEVKYRRSAKQGSGLDYITAKKLRQMELAARFWLVNHEWAGDYRLAALEVSGSGFMVTSFVA